eukprot:TRINITY_DN15668_c0_g1_i2.p1 TRINITY_DN15668_c0_g1~~TRINITY_DN15668_c0_g1_i2.p1  ORF type:complete len:672 (-),score=117.30 TRINITY_DN15668_c0_g1_i2:268-2283(-)
MAGSPQNERSKGASENVSGGDGENICELLPDSASQNDDAKSLRHRKRTLRDSSHLSSYGRSSSSESNYRCSFANDAINDHSSEYASLAFQASPTPSLGTPSSEQNRPSTSASKSSPTQGLGRCQTAPCRYPNNDSQVSGDLQSHKHASRFRSIQLERLSEREKMRLIENLAKIKNDGTIEVDVMRSTPVASELLGIDVSDTRQLNTTGFESDQNKVIPKLNIAMLIVGTRGDVQPFVAIAKRLQEYGHRVRLATHANFCSFIRTFGIEFYPLRGDPRALAEYMARNKGFLPSAPSEISFQRKQLRAIINSLLPACIEADIDTGAPFRAQAIIANPPAYGHVHVAEALHVPLHIFFTMPWTPTVEFPHPLARVTQSAGYWLSYFVVDILIWWGIRGIINDFRTKKLKLPPIAYLSSYHGSIADLPTGYMWSPHLVPKPNDWGHLVDVVGFCFLNLGSSYKPSEDFLQWLQAGPKPIYVGFGSMPLDDPLKTTGVILEALKITGQRGIIDKGWGNLGHRNEVPKYVYLLENCPHDWLFPQCSAVIHHGGAGTTAAGLRAGCPTTILPFFGDQYFWGDRVHDKGVGPAPIPIRQLTTETLVQAIYKMLDPEVKQRAIELAKHIEEEDGIVGAVNAFHKHLPPTLPEPVPPSEQPNIFQYLLQILERCCCLPFST